MTKTELSLIRLEREILKTQDHINDLARCLEGRRRSLLRLQERRNRVLGAVETYKERRIKEAGC